MAQHANLMATIHYTNRTSFRESFDVTAHMPPAVRIQTAGICSTLMETLDLCVYMCICLFILYFSLLSILK